MSYAPSVSSTWRQEWEALVADTGVLAQPLLFIPGASKSLQIWLQKDSLSGQTGSLITQPLNILRHWKFSACLVLSKCTRQWGWYSWHLILPIYKLFIWSELISYAPSIVNEETKKLARHIHPTHKMACINLSGLLFLSSDFWESSDYCNCNDTLAHFLFVHPQIGRTTEKVTIYYCI